MAEFEKFLKSLKDKKANTEIKALTKVPQKENVITTPHIKNNIFQPDYLNEVDLLYLPDDRGFKYALVVVDVYNSKCDSVALKVKSSAEVLEGLITIYGKKKPILNIPQVLQFDEGKEFKGAIVKFCKDEDIRAKYTLVNRHRQNAVVEHKNKEIGDVLLKFQAKKEIETGKVNKSWVKELPALIKYLNKHLPQRDTKKPIDDVLVDKYTRDLIPLHTHVRSILDYPVSAHDNKRVASTFRSGDLRWNNKDRTVERIILNNNMPPMYQLNGPNDGLDNRVAFTRSNLQIISPNEIKAKKKK